MCVYLLGRLKGGVRIDAYRRTLAIVITLGFFFLAVVVLPDSVAAASSSRTWTTDADWLSGSIGSGLTLAGTGEAARLELRRYDSPEWMQMAPATVPKKRDMHCIAWIEPYNSFLMFGGYSAGGMLNDTWMYDFAIDEWTRLTPPVSPLPRCLHDCVYDPRQEVVVLFGGMVEEGGWRSETWWFDIHTREWSLKPASGEYPGSMTSSHLVYDTRAERVLLIALNFLDDLETWAYDTVTNTWSNRNPSPNIGKRDSFAIAYAKGSGQTVLYGGSWDLVTFSETFEYNYSSNAWQYATGGPGDRYSHAMSYRDSLSGILMLGGKSFGTDVEQTWLYQERSRKWKRAGVGVVIAGRENPRMAYSLTDDATLLFGGYERGVGIHNDTWILYRWYDVDRDAGWVSDVVNTGCTSPAYGNIWYNQTSLTKPPDTMLRFQIATSASPTGPWAYRGPGGVVTTYYQTEGQAIDSIHDGEQYVRVLALLRTSNPRITPRLEDLKVTWTCPGGAPYITDTTPIHGELGHPLTAPIWVTFSEPMDDITVDWSITGGITLTGSWSNGYRTLRLTPSPSFTSCTQYTANITQGKSQTGLDLVPGPVPNPWTFVTYCPNPYIVFTDPEDGDANVLAYASIIVGFSEPMDTSTVSWTITGGVDLIPSWDTTDSVLTLFNYDTPYRDGFVYEVTISGKDKSGLALVPGPVPNPWTFTGEYINPYIVLTDPEHDATGVPVDKVIVVTFNEPMNTTTVTWTIAPDVNLTDSWNAARTVLSLTPDPALFPLAPHVVEITSGEDDAGLTLAGGLIPNPWLFFTEQPPLSAPANLRVVLSLPNVVLYWDPVSGAASYNVYETQDRFASFPSSWNPLGSTSGTSFTVSGDGADSLTHFYIVRAYSGTSEGVNSTMGVKKAFSFTRSPVNSNVQWFSLPYNSTYKKASDIANELGPSKIDVVGEWDPVMQRATVYYFARGMWRGTDFTIDPGDGLYLSVLQSFGWNVTGTDASVTLSFTLNPPPKRNVDWVGIPYTGIYSKASDISSTLRSMRISEIGLWDAATQTVVRWYWDGSMWTGTDFTFEPGAGTYFVVVASFIWTPTLITPTVP